MYTKKELEEMHYNAISVLAQQYGVLGHSSTTWTEFCHFLTPPPLPTLSVDKKRYFFDPSRPPHNVHVVIE